MRTLRELLGMSQTGIGRQHAQQRDQSEEEETAQVDLNAAREASSQQGYLDVFFTRDEDHDLARQLTHAIGGLTLPHLLYALVHAYRTAVPESLGMHNTAQHESCTPLGACAAAGCRTGTASMDCPFTVSVHGYLQESSTLSTAGRLSSAVAPTESVADIGSMTQKLMHRHAMQQAALVCALHASRMVLSSPPTAGPRCTFAEFGAGKGGLSLAIDRLCPGSCRFLLLDRAGSAGSGKADKSLRKSGADWKRVRADIAHVYVPGLEIPPGPVIAGGKHLCGGATDLTLRATMESGLSSVAGVGIATCCHHACTWEAYTGQDWWRARYGLTAPQFEVVRLVSAWAVCGESVGRGKDEEDDSERTQQHAEGLQRQEGLPFDLWLPPLPPNEPGHTKAWLISLPRTSRRALGRMAKRLIDVGRVAYLQQKGMQAQLWTYVTGDVTVENTLLLATPSAEASA